MADDAAANRRRVVAGAAARLAGDGMMRSGKLNFLAPMTAFLVLASLAGTTYMCSGCLAFDPGGQAAKSLDQRFKVFWENETLKVETRGPHEASWEVAGGELVLSTDEAGNTTLNPVQSKIEYWLRYYPSAEAAAGVSPVYAEQSTAQMEFVVPPLTQLVSELIEAYKELAMRPPAPPEGDGDGG